MGESLLNGTPKKKKIGTRIFFLNIMLVGIVIEYKGLMIQQYEGPLHNCPVNVPFIRTKVETQVRPT